MVLIFFKGQRTSARGGGWFLACNIDDGSIKTFFYFGNTLMGFYSLLFFRLSKCVVTEPNPLLLSPITFSPPCGGEPSPLEINLQPLLEFIWSVVACRCQRFADVGAGYDHHRVLVLNYLMISLIPKVRGRDKYSELPVP